jgi:hypothetical protein
MTLNELKEELRTRGAKLSGRKQELVDRSAMPCIMLVYASVTLCIN